MTTQQAMNMSPTRCRLSSKMVLSISCVLAALLLTLWPMSYQRTIMWRNRPPTHLPFLTVYFDDGELQVYRVYSIDPVTEDEETWRAIGGFTFGTCKWRSMTTTDEPAGFTLRGRIYFDEQGTPHWGKSGLVRLRDVGDFSLIAPIWAVAAVFLFLPLRVATRGPLRKWWRIRRGRCCLCGSKLANTTSRVCRACGSPRADPNPRCTITPRE